MTHPKCPTQRNIFKTDVVLHQKLHFFLFLFQETKTLVPFPRASSVHHDKFCRSQVTAGTKLLTASPARLCIMQFVGAKKDQIATHTHKKKKIRRMNVWMQNAQFSISSSAYLWKNKVTRDNAVVIQIHNQINPGTYSHTFASQFMS